MGWIEPSSRHYKNDFKHRLFSEKDDEEKKNDGCCGGAIGSLVFVLLVMWIWPGIVPFDLFEFFYLDFSDGVFNTCLLLAAWAVMINLVQYTRRRKLFLEDPGEVFISGAIVSALAGVLEELIFRWIFFYSAIIGLKIFNFLLFGLTEVVYEWLLCPVANFCTFGLMSELIYHNLGWFIGAAVISANGRFRDGHSYQGCFGWINSWFGGMIFFHLMFNHGIYAAMIVHFIYDFVIFSFWALMAVQDRARLEARR